MFGDFVGPLIERLTAAVKAMVTRLAANLVAAVFVLIALGFGTAALFIAIADEWGALAACLVLAAIALLAAAICYLIGRRAGTPQRGSIPARVAAERVAAQPYDDEAVAAVTISNIAGKAGSAQPLLYLALAAVAGFAAARRSG